MFPSAKKYGKWTSEDMERAISALERGDMGITADNNKNITVLLMN